MRTRPLIILFLCCFFIMFSLIVCPDDIAKKDREEKLISEIFQLYIPDHNQNSREYNPDLPPTSETSPSDFLFYWVRRFNKNVDVQPTTEEDIRIFRSLNEAPFYLQHFLRFFPADELHIKSVYSLYERFGDKSTKGEDWEREVRTWLMRNSSFFRSELISSAKTPKGGEEDLIALSRMDWNCAEPIVKKLARSGIHPKAILACGILFGQKIREGREKDIKRLKEKMIRLSLDSEAPAESRVNALNALLNNIWPGRDDWFLSLLRKPELKEIRDQNSYISYNPISQAIWENSNQWISLLSQQVGKSDSTVHNMAAYLLAKMSPTAETLRPLLPCLTEPSWCWEETRHKVIEEFDKVYLPECISGLLWCIKNDSDLNCRINAAGAIANYQDPRIVPALRELLPQVLKDYPLSGESVIYALIKSQGFLNEEFASFLDANASFQFDIEDTAVSELSSADQEEYLRYIGDFLIRRHIDLPEEVFAFVVKRICQYKSEGKLDFAAALEKSLYYWSGDTIKEYMAEQLWAGEANAATIAKILNNRCWFVENHLKELNKLIQTGGAFAGISLAILNDQHGISNLLLGKDRMAIRALLGCLRFMQIVIPLNELSGLLMQADPRLVSAIDSYLFALDTFETRNLLLNLEKEKSRIVGRFPGYDAGHDSNEDFQEMETELISEMEESNGTDEIIALLTAGYWGDAGQLVIRKTGENSYLSIYQDRLYILKRELKEQELNGLKEFIESNGIDGLRPLTNSGVSDGMQYEYLHLKKKGGIRIVMNNPGMGHPSEDEDKYIDLLEYFHKLKISGRVEAIYKVKDECPDLEVLLARTDCSVHGVFKEGNELRVLVRSIDSSDFIWKSLSEDKKLTPVAESEEIKIAGWKNDLGLSKSYSLWERARFPWQTRFHSGFILTGRDEFNKEGIWYCRRKKKPKEILLGQFTAPLVSKDQRWLIALQQVKASVKVVRINLKTREIFPVYAEGISSIEPLAFIPTLGKFLLISPIRYEEGDKEKHKFYFLDPDSGDLSIAKGDFSPWEDINIRYFQSTDQINVVWAAKMNPDEEMTEIGKYDLQRFVFSLYRKIPGIPFTTTDMWVDQGEKKIYIVYGGHLLRFALDKEWIKNE